MQNHNIPGKIITLSSLEEMFDSINKKGIWDMSKPMLWGYFFTHQEPKKLDEAKVILVKKGYRFVDIYIAEKQDKNEPELWWLHVEKEEIHSPQTLDKRNDELYLLANKLGLNSYDGMDVGPIQQIKR